MASAIQFLSGGESVPIQLSDHIREDKGTKKRKKNDPLEKEKRIEKLIPHLSEHHCARITRLVIPHVAKHMGSLSPEDKERAMEGVPQIVGYGSGQSGRSDQSGQSGGRGRQISQGGQTGQVALNQVIFMVRRSDRDESSHFSAS